MEDEFNYVCNKIYEGEDWSIMKNYINNNYISKEETKQLEAENHNMKEKLESYIPRRRVRRIYKMLGDILEADTDTKPYITTLKNFINKIEKEGKAEAGQEVKAAIEHLLSVRER